MLYFITHGTLLLIKWLVGIVLTLAFLLLLDWTINKMKIIFKNAKNKFRRHNQRKS